MKKIARETKALLEEIQDLRLSLFKNISFDVEKAAVVCGQPAVKKVSKKRQ